MPTLHTLKLVLIATLRHEAKVLRYVRGALDGEPVPMLYRLLVKLEESNCRKYSQMQGVPEDKFPRFVEIAHDFIQACSHFSFKNCYRAYVQYQLSLDELNGKAERRRREKERQETIENNLSFLAAQERIRLAEQEVS